MEHGSEWVFYLIFFLHGGHFPFYFYWRTGWIHMQVTGELDLTDLTEIWLDKWRWASHTCMYVCTVQNTHMTQHTASTAHGKRGGEII